MMCERFLIIIFIFGIWCDCLSFRVFRLFYEFLIVELLIKFVVIIISVIVYVKGILYLFDFKILLMYYNFFF